MSYPARPLPLASPITPFQHSSSPPQQSAPRDQSSRHPPSHPVKSEFLVEGHETRRLPNTRYGDSGLLQSSAPPPLPPTPPPLRPPSMPPVGSFSESFPDMAGQWDLQAAEKDNGPNVNMDGDSKLLSFSPARYSFPMLEMSGRQVSLSIAAQLHGMFFLAESPWAAGDTNVPPAELTCYRRNLFQVSGSVILPRAFRYIVTDLGEQVPVVSQELCISATESVEGNPVKIISVPWKTPTGTTTTEEKVEREPPSIPLDLHANPDSDSEYTTIPISWKRLQFRIATANNGRRKELQQHFVVSLKLIVTLMNGLKLPVCELRSGAVIVRGRSPRNFQARKDFPLSGTPSSRRSATFQSAPAHASTSDEKNSPELPAPDVKPETDDLQLTPDFLEWMSLAETDNSAIFSGIMPTYTQDSAQGYDVNILPGQDIFGNLPAPLVAPASLPLTDDESPRKRPSASSVGSLKRPNKHARVSPVAQTTTMPSISRSASLGMPDQNQSTELYQYFALAPDEWVPPVEAVVRPHGTHHTGMAPDPQVQAASGRNSRYYSRDEAF